MPLTSKGKKILRSMRKQYGPEKAEKVFYASKNKGKISGVDEHMDSYTKIGRLLAEAMGLMKSKKAKGLAGLYPPYDKITRGDVITGRLKGKKDLTEGEARESEDKGETKKPKANAQKEPKARKPRYWQWLDDPTKRWWGPGPHPADRKPKK